VHHDRRHRHRPLFSGSVGAFRDTGMHRSALPAGSVRSRHESLLRAPASLDRVRPWNGLLAKDQQFPRTENDGSGTRTWMVPGCAKNFALGRDHFILGQDEKAGGSHAGDPPAARPSARGRAQLAAGPPRLSMKNSIMRALSIAV
jgi:hypothetical protein